MDDHESPRAATASLFSLQVAVHALSFQPPPGGPLATGSSPFVLAFQLLRFDIVLFETSTLERHAHGVVALAARDDEDPVAQSCLFECDAQRLAHDIEADADAALVLLVLEREAQRARLVAFACVRLELPHLALATTPRVSEWASVETTWPLVDHQHAPRGCIRGTVTLACLGRALAPHLALGGNSVRLTSPVAMSPSSVASREEEKALMEPFSDSAAPFRTSVPETPDEKINGPLKLQDLSSAVPKHEELRDAAVQCEDPDDDKQSHHRVQPKPILIRGGGATPTSSRFNASPRLRVVDELDRLQIGAGSSPRQRKETPHRRRDRIRVSYEEPTTQRFSRSRWEQPPHPFLEAELPPPLFFHKPKLPQSLRQSSRS